MRVCSQTRPHSDEGCSWRERARRARRVKAASKQRHELDQQLMSAAQAMSQFVFALAGEPAAQFERRRQPEIALMSTWI